MGLAITDLPTILDVLHVSGAPNFVVLRYRDYIRFAALAGTDHAPEVVSVLDAGGEHEFVIVAFDAYWRGLISLDIVGHIDEASYLAWNPDVATAVERGEVTSGNDHYLFQGYLERRRATLPATIRAAPVDLVAMGRPYVASARLHFSGAGGRRGAR